MDSGHGCSGTGIATTLAVTDGYAPEGAVADPGPSPENDASTIVTRPAGSSAASLSSDRDAKSSTRRRLGVIAAILVFAGIAFGFAFALLPDQQVITNPLGYTVGIQEMAGPVITAETFTAEQRSDGAIEITATPGLSSTGPFPRPVLAVIYLTFYGANIKVIQCPDHGDCNTGVGQSGPQVNIKFSVLAPGSPTFFAVRFPSSFGSTENSETALAQLPQVSLQPSTGEPFTFNTIYYIPGANTYNWSTPPLNVYPNKVTWMETINPANNHGTQAAAATELTGTDIGAQTSDNRDIFISGGLFGIVGAALFAAVQEFLHLIFKTE
jgi:hypothetical protein